MSLGGTGLGGTGLGGWWPNVSSVDSPVMTSTSSTQLAVARIVCWKCAKAEGKFLYQHGAGLTWCEECYVVRQLSGPTLTP